MAELQVELVAANGKLWEGEASQVSARGVEGDLGVLPGHVPMLTALAAGDVRIESGSGEKTVTVDGGFLSVDEDRVTIVVENAQQA
ncbi:F0F1 ATP synthase subunit epsilon [Piscicoccus intestinalis]|uniref:F0F1 ATP synthase subunit epsilon n=1 Tax=Piscicoccus intestinalis TaxID=746033 RepID=UPI00083802EF|nr:F0F1 ATP synthase subunit epsilon [Piscicoccus intestinalis]